MYKIGLIGYGAFGHALVGWLGDSSSFSIYDKAMAVGSIESALAQPIIVLNIPAQNLQEFLVTHAALLPADALYIDVCSVKVNPIRIMEQYLPPTAQIIGTHPLFGPQTAQAGVSGHKIMVTPVRVNVDVYDAFKQFLASLELQILETTPEEHDQAMAYSQGLSHYIGRIMKQLNIPETELATQAYEDLLDMKRIQGNDSDALYYSIIHDNPYTLQVHRKFEAAQRIVEEEFAIDLSS